MKSPCTSNLRDFGTTSQDLNCEVVINCSERLRSSKGMRVWDSSMDFISIRSRSLMPNSSWKEVASMYDPVWGGSWGVIHGEYGWCVAGCHIGGRYEP